jgi:hypothetical protein
MEARSRGVTLLGWFYIIYCSIFMLTSITSIIMTGYGSYVLENTPKNMSEERSEELSNLQWLVTQNSKNFKDYIGTSIASLIGVIVGVGLLRLKRQAWVFVYFISLFHILRSFHFLFFHRGVKNPLVTTITLVISFVFIYFISRPKVSEQFK